MRITSQSLSTQVNEGLQQAYQRLARAQEAVTSGRRINHLSDDPIGATRTMGLRSFEDSLNQYGRNISGTLPFLEQTDAALEDVVEGLTRAKELAVQLANDTYSPIERQAAAKEIRQIFLQTLAVANTKVENRFLFGGFLNGAAPFAETANGANYLGDNGQIFIQTNAASSLPINLLGNQVFQGTGIVGGQGVFDVLRDLERLLEGNSFVNSLALGVNLDAALPAGAGFSPPNAVGTEAPPATWLGEANFSTTVSVFDSKGKAHNLTVLFAKTAASTFRYRVVANSNEIIGGTPGNLYQVAPEGTLAFNPDGSFNAAGSTLTNITLVGLANGAADITINAANISFAGSTHLAKPSAVLTLAQGNPGAFATQLGRVDAVIDQLLTFRAEVGSRLNSAQVADDSLEVLRVRTRGARSKIEDADVLAVYSDFARFKHAFDAALQSASQVLRPSLLDFLR